MYACMYLCKTEPEIEESNIVVKCQQSVATTGYLCCQDTLNIFNAIYTKQTYI